MSIVHTLKKVVDPIRARAEEAERKAQREQQKQQEAGDAPLYHCKVCEREDDQGAYCPGCLADTMVPGAAPGVVEISGDAAGDDG